MLKIIMDYIKATYFIETPLEAEEAAAILAGEQSSGTFVKVPGESDEIKEMFGARVVRVTPLHPVVAPFCAGARPSRSGRYNRAYIELWWPAHNTAANIPVLLSTVAGGTYDLNAFSGIKLTDLEIPECFTEKYRGPRFGIDGTRTLTGVSGRPIIGSIVKPCIGLTPEETAQQVKILAEGGIDFIKDDELIADHPRSPFESRVREVMKVINRHADDTGKKVMYAFNLSGDIDDMLRRHDTVADHGGTAVMVNMINVGFAGLAKLRENARLPIHGHRCGFGALNRAELLGMEFTPLQKLWKLVGIDHIHTNGLRNKFYESDQSVLQSVRACQEPLFDRWRVLPVMGSGAWAGLAPDTWKEVGNSDLLFLCGGGILGHPGGIRAGVESVRQAWEAAMNGIDLHVHSKEHRELKEAMEFFHGKA
jgi:ribulose-bisphosphate carboxylase large chain